MIFFTVDLVAMALPFEKRTPRGTQERFSQFIARISMFGASVSHSQGWRAAGKG